MLARASGLLLRPCMSMRALIWLFLEEIWLDTGTETRRSSLHSCHSCSGTSHSTASPEKHGSFLWSSSVSSHFLGLHLVLICHLLNTRGTRRVDVFIGGGQKRWPRHSCRLRPGMQSNSSTADPDTYAVRAQMGDCSHQIQRRPCLTWNILYKHILVLKTYLTHTHLFFFSLRAPQMRRWLSNKAINDQIFT